MRREEARSKFLIEVAQCGHLLRLLHQEACNDNLNTRQLNRLRRYLRDFKRALYGKD